MKYLLSGISIAAALTVAAPVWAQAPTQYPTTPPSGAYGQQPQPAPYAQQPSNTYDHTAYRHAHHRYYGHMRHRYGRGYGHAYRGLSNDHVANQLNREQLRPMGSSMPPAGYGPPGSMPPDYPQMPPGHPQQPPRY
jgi:hypothetical protein